MGGFRNYGPFLGTLNIRCRIIIGIQKGTIILTTTHIYIYMYIYIYMHLDTGASPHAPCRFRTRALGTPLVRAKVSLGSLGAFYVQKPPDPYLTRRRETLQSAHNSSFVLPVSNP